MIEQRKHPVCEVASCDRLQSKKIELGSPLHPNVKLGLCEMHASWFESAKDLHVSMGSKVLGDCDGTEKA